MCSFGASCCDMGVALNVGMQTRDEIAAQATRAAFDALNEAPDVTLRIMLVFDPVMDVIHADIGAPARYLADAAANVEAALTIALDRFPAAPSELFTDTMQRDEIAILRALYGAANATINARTAMGPIEVGDPILIALNTATMARDDVRSRRVG